MRHWASALLCLFAALPCFAQSQFAVSEPVSSEAYQRIEAVRARESANFDAQEVACYERFAVNDCLKQVQSKRRAVLADLKRQETRLHERERSQQGAEALHRIEQKSLERKQRQEDIQAKDGAGTTQDKLQEQNGKQAEHAAKAASGTATVTAPTPTGPTAAEQAQARASYERKQANAEKRRQELDKRQAEHDGKPAKPLPLPP